MEKRQTKRGQIASAVGIALNALLAALKMTFGIMFGLVSLLADGVNNLSDCGSGTVSLVSLRISNKPADKEHPYGHQRAEYIASMFIGFFVLLLAVELFRESVEKIIAGVLPEAFWGIYLLLGVSVLVKAFMFFLYRYAAKKEGADTLRAAAKDSACDCIATFAVAAGLLLSRYCGVAADGWAGLAVALFIVWEGVQILREASSKLLGQAPDPAVLDKIRAVIAEGNGVLGLHDLRAYRFGPDKLFATVHVQMDASLPALLSHEALDKIERKVFSELGVELTVHLDPVDLHDEEARLLEERIRAASEGITDGLNLHDFRLVRGVKKVLVFEAGVPYSCPKTDGEIADDLKRAVRILSDAEPAVTVERE